MNRFLAFAGCLAFVFFIAALSEASSIKEAGQGALGLALLIAMWVGSLAIYLLPSIVAYHRGHNAIGSIVVLNVLLGWTFIGWVVALVWAAGPNVTRKDVGRETPGPSA